MRRTALALAALVAATLSPLTSAQTGGGQNLPGETAAPDAR